jgi:non-homologous end joining protein Ku
MHRMQEYTVGMIDIINTIMGQNSKTENLERLEDLKNTQKSLNLRTSTSEKQDDNKLFEQEETVLESDVVKVMEAFQNSIIANVNAATNNLSLISLKSK